MSTTIVYGPMACGKTRNRQALAAHFGCGVIVDDFDPRHHLVKPGALHLTNVRPPDGPNVHAFDRIRFDRTASADARIMQAVPRRYPELLEERRPYRRAETT